jgi:hypothetical protein
MITQPNPGRGIIVTFNMVSSIARANATICICFVDDLVANRLVVLDYLSWLEQPLQRGRREDLMF